MEQLKSGIRQLLHRVPAWIRLLLAVALLFAFVVFLSTGLTLLATAVAIVGAACLFMGVLSVGHIRSEYPLELFFCLVAVLLVATVLRTLGVDEAPSGMASVGLVGMGAVGYLWRIDTSKQR